MRASPWCRGGEPLGAPGTSGRAPPARRIGNKTCGDKSERKKKKKKKEKKKEPCGVGENAV
jgi:hypothetical protein